MGVQSSSVDGRDSGSLGDDVVGRSSRHVGPVVPVHSEKAIYLYFNTSLLSYLLDKKEGQGTNIIHIKMFKCSLILLFSSYIFLNIESKTLRHFQIRKKSYQEPKVNAL